MSCGSRKECSYETREAGDCNSTGQVGTGMVVTGPVKSLR